MVRGKGVAYRLADFFPWAKVKQERGRRKESRSLPELTVWRGRRPRRRSRWLGGVVGGSSRAGARVVWQRGYGLAPGGGLHAAEREEEVSGGEVPEGAQ